MDASILDMKIDHLCKLSHTKTITFDLIKQTSLRLKAEVKLK